MNLGLLFHTSLLRKNVLSQHKIIKVRAFVRMQIVVNLLNAVQQQRVVRTVVEPTAATFLEYFISENKLEMNV